MAVIDAGWREDMAAAALKIDAATFHRTRAALRKDGIDLAGRAIAEQYPAQVVVAAESFADREVGAHHGYHEALSRFDYEMAMAAIAVTEGKRQQAAQLLGVHRNQLRKMERRLAHPVKHGGGAKRPAKREPGVAKDIA